MKKIIISVTVLALLGCQQMIHPWLFQTDYGSELRELKLPEERTPVSGDLDFWEGVYFAEDCDTFARIKNQKGGDQL